MALPIHCPQSGKLFLRWGDGVLRGLGHAELHYRLGLDLDGLAGLRIAPDARLALCLYKAADAGDYEDAVLLGFLDGGLRQQVQEGRRLLVSEFLLLCHVPREGGLGHSSSHAIFLLLGAPLGPPVLPVVARVSYALCEPQ